MTSVQVENLKAEVKNLKQFHIWRIFQETLKQYAIDMAFKDSKNYEEVLGGKMMAHNLGVQKQIVDIIDAL